MTELFPIFNTAIKLSPFISATCTSSKTICIQKCQSASKELACFIVAEDILSILVDQNCTMSATGMVLESLWYFNKQKYESE